MSSFYSFFSKLFRINRLRFLLFSFSVCLVIVMQTNIIFIKTAHSAQATLGWNESKDDKLAGYKVYYGNSSKNYLFSVDVGNRTKYTLKDLAAGKKYFIAIKAYNTSGIESAFSDEIVYTVPKLDTSPPTITSVDLSDSLTQISIHFSEPVKPLTASNRLNYAISNGIKILKASPSTDLMTVHLKTSEHAKGVTYNLTANKITDMAKKPNVINENTNFEYTFVAPLEISNIIVTSGQDYKIVTKGLQKGVKVYIDSDVTFKDLPNELKGATYIKTADKDKALVTFGSLFLIFNVNQDATVYVAHDDRIVSKPNWLESFVDTNSDLVTSGSTLSLFRKDFLVGAIALGGNEGKDGDHMYAVIITRQKTLTD